MPFGFAAALTSGLCYRFQPKALSGKVHPFLMSAFSFDLSSVI
jgi:hypothetical protein